jgi:hypothetical protein
MLQPISVQAKLQFIVIMVFAVFSIVCAQQRMMRKGPYLIYPNRPTQMTVLWQLENSAMCLLRWGSTPACSMGSVLTTETGQDTNEHQHIYTLSELSPGRIYYYQVIENDVMHAGSFRSAPPDTADSTSFFVYGDTRTYPEMHDSVMLSISRALGNDTSCQTFLMHAGDWNSSSMEEYWDTEYFNRAYSNTMEVLSKIPVLGARGSHEDDVTVYRKYWPYPYESGGFYYAFDYGPVHIAVVDQFTDYSPGSEQFRWLERSLALSDKKWKFIMLHEPGYSAEGSHADNVSVQTIIQPFCRKYRVNGVFAGHNHFYAHCLVDGVHHLTLGGGGAPLYPAGQSGKGLIKSVTSLHYAYVKALSDSAVVTVIRPDGAVIDNFSIRKTPDPEPPIYSTKKTALIKVNTIPYVKFLVIDISDCKNATLAIANICGAMVLKKTLKTPRTVIDCASYPNGLYCARIALGAYVAPVKFILF